MLISISLKVAAIAPSASERYWRCQSQVLCFPHAVFCAIFNALPKCDLLFYCHKYFLNKPCEYLTIQKSIQVFCSIACIGILRFKYITFRKYFFKTCLQEKVVSFYMSDLRCKRNLRPIIQHCDLLYIIIKLFQ